MQTIMAGKPANYEAEQTLLELGYFRYSANGQERLMRGNEKE